MKKAVPKKALAKKNSTGGDQPVRAGIKSNVARGQFSDTKRKNAWNTSHASDYPNSRANNDIAGFTGKTSRNAEMFFGKGKSAIVTVPGRTRQRSIDQAARRKMANAKKVAKGKK